MTHSEEMFAEDGSTKRCRGCGHPLAWHYHENAPIVENDSPGGPCHASVSTLVQMGVNMTRCQCRRFA